MDVNKLRKDKGSRNRRQPTRRFLHKSPVSVRRSISASVEKGSVYYWWWAYLRKNERYKSCCKRGGKGRLAKLYEDFGDVFNVDFKTWWETDGRGERLFAEPLAPVRLEELRTEDEWQEDWTRESVMVVVVPLSEPKRRLKRWFNNLLLRRHKGRPGIPTIQDSKALYPVHTKFSTQALEQMLMVYELRQEEPDLTLAALGEKLRLVATAMPKEYDQPYELAAKRNTMAATVSRYLKKAAAIIENTANGDFPCTD
jgi:hypothetical protein